MKSQGNSSLERELEDLQAKFALLENQVQVLSRDNESLAKDNARLASDIGDIKKATDEEIERITAERDKEIAHWKGECERLIEQIELANMRYFGSKSERVIPSQLSLFNEMEADTDPSVKEPALEEVLETKVRRRGGKRKLDLTKFKTVVIDYVLPAEDLICPACESTMDEFKCEVTHTVKLVPAHLIVEEHRRHVYICKPCSKENSEDGITPTEFRRAEKPLLPIERSFASPSLIAYILNGKYVNHLPLYRMEEDFKYLGLEISRQNMANWTISVHEKWLSLIHARMKEKLLEGDIIHCDESEIQVLKEPGRQAKQKSRMWLFCAPATSKPNYIYEYHTTRSGSVANEFFKGWKGVITTDGYEPYFKLGEDIKNTACLVHVRRKFAEIVKVAGGDIKAAQVESVALKARRMIDEMFSIDSAFDDMEIEARRLARNEKLKPKMEAFEIWAQKQIDLAVPKMALYSALAYALKYWPYVKNVLTDGRLELSNNIAERAIKPFVIGRKNYLFSDTQKGAHASAGIYSIVTTAKMNGLNPRLYLEWLLETLPNTADLDDNDMLDQFLPWSDGIPDSCRLSPKAAAKALKMEDDPIIDIDPEVFEKES